MTGDTENGRSISVVKSALPLNSNLAIAHAAAIPKTTLSGTAMAATVNVSLMAAHASGSTSAAIYSDIPLRKASTKTATTGRMRKERQKGKRQRNQRNTHRRAFGHGAMTGASGFMRHGRISSVCVSE